MSNSGKTQAMILAGFLIVGLLSAVEAEAGTVRGHSYSHSHGSSHYGGWHYGPSYSYSYGYAYGYAPFYAGYGYYAGYPGVYYGPGYAYGPAYATEAAYIDTDIQPEDTAVFLDGEPVGTVDDFDGFPRFLAVTPGKHQLTFKAEGRSAVTRSIRVPSGALLQLDFTLPRSGDAGNRAATKTDLEIIIPDPGKEEKTPPDAEPGQSGSAQQEQGTQTGQAPGFMRIQIKPGDASVYMDGELLGSASKLAGLHGDLRIEAGVHKVEAVRPGFHAGSKRILVGEGEHISIEFELEKVAE